MRHGSERARHRRTIALRARSARGITMQDSSDRMQIDALIAYFYSAYDNRERATTIESIVTLFRSSGHRCATPGWAGGPVFARSVCEAACRIAHEW
jgi:hypothetical protein